MSRRELNNFYLYLMFVIKLLLPSFQIDDLTLSLSKLRKFQNFVIDMSIVLKYL